MKINIKTAFTQSMDAENTAFTKVDIHSGYPNILIKNDTK
jgi:hypothetical protein